MPPSNIWQVAVGYMVSIARNDLWRNLDDPLSMTWLNSASYSNRGFEFTLTGLPTYKAKEPSLTHYSLMAWEKRNGSIFFTNVLAQSET